MSIYVRRFNGLMITKLFFRSTSGTANLMNGISLILSNGLRTRLSRNKLMVRITRQIEVKCLNIPVSSHQRPRSKIVVVPYLKLSYLSLYTLLVLARLSYCVVTFFGWKDPRTKEYYGHHPMKNFMGFIKGTA